MLWEWFIQLDATRSLSEAGAQPITYQEIAAWQQCTGWRVRPWEVEVIRAMDVARCRIWNRRQEKKTGINVRDSGGIAAFLRSFRSQE